jgi:hypothetical protein
VLGEGRSPRRALGECGPCVMLGEGRSPRQQRDRRRPEGSGVVKCVASLHGVSLHAHIDGPTQRVTVAVLESTGSHLLEKPDDVCEDARSEACRQAHASWEAQLRRIEDRFVVVAKGHSQLGKILTNPHRWCRAV